LHLPSDDSIPAFDKSTYQLIENNAFVPRARAANVSLDVSTDRHAITNATSDDEQAVSIESDSPESPRK
jgi:hypothetical protein